MRMVASIRIGKIGADVALRLLGSAAQGDPAYKAADHLGRLLRSIFLCDYVAIPAFRREIYMLLSRGESVLSCSVRSTPARWRPNVVGDATR
jgi:TnpA family transposase